MSEARRPRGAERRRGRRAHVRLEAAYEDANAQVFIRTYDISEYGAFLLTAHPPEPGVSASLVVELPGHPAILRLRGIVRRRRLGAEPGFGFEFDRRPLSAQVRASLRRFVEEGIGD